MRLDMLGPDEASREASRQATALADRMLAGTESLIAGARELQRLGRWIVPDIGVDKDFVVFLAFDSETDHLPVDEERKNWDPAALQRKDREIAEYEKKWSPRVRAACSSIVSRFGAA
jgi:hypothetical protein